MLWCQAFRWYPPTHAESMKFPKLDLLLAGLAWLREKRKVEGHAVHEDFDKHVTSLLPLPSPSAELCLLCVP